MANPHKDETGAQRVDEKLRQAGEKSAEQTRQMGQTAIDAGQDAARAGADLLQKNAETLQNSWRSGLDTTSALMGSSADQFSRALGLSGDGAQQAAERSARNTEVILCSSAVVGKCMTAISREYLEYVRRQTENNMQRMNDLWKCRTPHDFAALQTDLVRQSFEGALESGRRMANMSLKLADDAAKHISENIGRMGGAA
jgi:phasin family protein